MNNRHRTQRGSVTLELVILVPALLLLLGTVVVAGRISTTGQSIEHAASMSARAASLARTPDAAREAAHANGLRALNDKGLDCTKVELGTSTTNFAGHGRPGTVTVTLSCTISLNDLLIPGLPGNRTMTATATSVVDGYREP